MTFLPVLAVFIALVGAVGMYFARLERIGAKDPPGDLCQPRAASVRFTDDDLIVALEDGRTITVPIAWYPRLLEATAAQRGVFELVGGGVGIHWPELDEDLSVRGMLNPTRFAL